MATVKATASASASSSARQGRTRRLLRGVAPEQDDQQDVEPAGGVFEGHAFEQGGGRRWPRFRGRAFDAAGGGGVEVLQDRCGGADDHELSRERLCRESLLQDLRVGDRSDRVGGSGVVDRQASVLEGESWESGARSSISAATTGKLRRLVVFAFEAAYDPSVSRVKRTSAGLAPSSRSSGSPPSIGVLPSAADVRRWRGRFCRERGRRFDQRVVVCGVGFAA